MRTTISNALVLGLVVACSANGVDPRGSLKSAVLHYSAASAQGVPLLAGSLRLAVHDDSTVTGTWAIDWIAGADTTIPVGPQVGHGTLSGRQMADGSAQLNLNPFCADNNVFLSAGRDRRRALWRLVMVGIRGADRERPLSGSVLNATSAARGRLELSTPLLLFSLWDQLGR